MERVRLKFLILAMSSAEKYGDTSLLICLTWQAIMMVLSRGGWKINPRGNPAAPAHTHTHTRHPTSPERARGESTLLAGQAAVRSDDLHSVSGFDHVHQVVVQDDVHRARQLASGGFLWHLLYRDGLVVLIDGEAELCLQRVVLLVLSRQTEIED